MKEKFSPEFCFAAYVKAFHERIDFSKLFDSDEVKQLWYQLYTTIVLPLFREVQISLLLDDEARKHNTKVELVFSNLFPALSILIAAKSSLLVKESVSSYTITPNIFLLSVCDSGGGKTQAFNRYLEDPLNEIAKMKKTPKLIYHEFTKSGLLKALKDNNGKLLWAADEFGELLVHALNPNDKEWKGFRGILNNFYSGRGISKAFAGRDTCILDRVTFSIAGTTQPQPFCAIMDKLMNTNDGLIDRFIQISAPGNSRPNYGPISKQIAEIPDDWPKKLLLYAYNQHANIESKNYELTNEALECLQSYRSAEQEHREMIYNEAEEALCSPSTSLKDFSFNFGDSKDIDNALRCALLLHVAKYSFEHVLSNNIIDIPKEIPIVTLQGAFELITILKKQLKVYTTMLCEEDLPRCSKLEAIATASRKVTNEQVDIRKQIMNFPGPVVTSSFLCRINRKLGAQEVITLFKHLGTYKAGDENYMGIYREVGVLHNRRSLCFFKAPRNEIKPELFDELEIDGHTYEQLLKQDISDEPPAKLAKLSQSWEAFYRELVDQYKICFNVTDE